MNSKTSASLQDITLEIVDGIKVVVPDSLNLITPYVLREQLDWFEDEIKFVRTLLKPGDKVLDIGANYGLYALSMAKVVGEHGHVYAFEPASKTASYLKRSIEQNSFNQISLIRSALSNKSGVAEFALNDHSEWNSLNMAMASHGNTESVDLTTLDILAAELPWQDVNFIKLDAEGEEINILAGGNHFLSHTSPLIMFELMHGLTVNTRLIEQLQTINYRLYKLIPGLNLLAPFSLNEQLDEYQLNLFACKDDCARRLEQEGRLVKSGLTVSNAIEVSGSWEKLIFQYPYAQYLKSKWQAAQQNTPFAGAETYLNLLSLYASMQSISSASQRYDMLKQVFSNLLELCGQMPTLPRLISLARVESELGQRGLALTAVSKSLSLVKGGMSLDEPFLAVSARFELLDPNDRITNWLVASLLEQMEKLEFYSSYYSGQSSLQRLAVLQNSGFQSAEMDRRVHLIKSRFGIQA